MKTIFTFIISLFFSMMLQAQVTKTVEVTSGNLSSLLTEDEKNTVTNLTLTGSIDARDFRTMKDSMPMLAVLDMSEAQINAYEGDGGTTEATTVYDADAIPREAFMSYVIRQPFLKSIQIPLTTKVIGHSSFRGCNSLTSFTIPSLVTDIHENAFNGCYNMAFVTIPESVETIGNSAFKSCMALTSVTLPSKVDSIQHSTFIGCDRLTSIDIPSTVTYIGSTAFMYCQSLESITLPSSLKTIGSYAFYLCHALKSITLPESLISIGKGAFMECKSIKGSIILPQGLSTIKDHTFADCIGLTSVEITSSVDSIGEAAFLRCTSLQSINLPSSVVFIGNSAFSECTSLSGTIILPASLKTISYKAFENCRRLTGELVIPLGVTAIKTQAFIYCSGLTSLVIPSSVTLIEYGAFSFCSNLDSIEVHHLFPLSLHAAQDVFLDVDKSTTTLHVPFGTKELYASAYGWEDFDTIVEDTQGFFLSATSVNFTPEGGSDNSIEVTANFAWIATSDQPWLMVSPLAGEDSQTLEITAQANTTLTSRKATVTLSAEGIHSQTIQVTQNAIPQSVSITPGGLAEAFTAEEKAVLSSLTLTGTMDARDFRTISNQMHLLEELDISGASIVAYTDTTYGNHITYSDNHIPSALWEWRDEFQTDYSISEHHNLTIVKLPAALKTIGYRAFYACSKLTTVELQSAVEKIGNEAFLNCPSLTSINLPASVTQIGERAFEKCSSLASIELPPAITIIKGSTFTECSSLLSIDIPVSVTAIEGHAFEGCSELRSIVIPPLVTVFEYSVFRNCSSLTSVMMPLYLKEIKPDAFQNCSSLTSITIPKSVTFIGNQAFDGCKNLQSIYSYANHPVNLQASDSWGVFDEIDKSSCILYVPYGSKMFYANSYGWKDFLNIVEMGEFTLSPSSLTLEPAQQSVTVELTTAMEWTVSSDQLWLTVAPASGAGNTTFTLTAEANPTVEDRTASVIFLTNAGTTPSITVNQEGIPVTVEVSAGNLSAEFPNEEQRKVNNLTLSGTMDARDFKFIRDHLPLVTDLDLSGVTIVAYSGIEGTYHTQYYEERFYDYPADEIPILAFAGYASNIKINFPPSVTSIGPKAFYYCSKLTEMTIPSTITSIGEAAFSGCYNLTSIDLPPTLTRIENYLFEACTNLPSLTLPLSVTSIGAYAFSTCLNLTLLEIPNSVTYIGRNAFEICYDLQTVILPTALDTINQETFNSSGITTLKIPASVKYIDADAFTSSHGLKSLYAYPIDPPDLSAELVFNITDQSYCTLYVPFGSKEKYAVADQWKNFFLIVEMGNFELSYTELTIGASITVEPITITIDGLWSAVSNQEWLTVSPAAGNSSQTIHINAIENKAFMDRTATITFSAANNFSQTVTVTQHSKINSIPLANAGADQSVEEGKTVQLDGSASTDADNDQLTYQWSAPEGIILSSESNAKPSFTAPRVEKDTTFTFKLVVKDGKDNSVSDKVIITVTIKTIELSLSEDSIIFESKESTAEIILSSNAEWTVSSDQPWLTVSHDEGTGDRTLSFTANANEEVTARMATVTVRAPEMEAQIIAITQKGIATKVAETAQNRPLISYYPNPFKEMIFINIHNPQKEKITVDIYNIGGQKVKNLTIDNRAEKITLSWDGSNEQGQKVTEGMYLLKMNEVAKQLVKQE